jgi:hypothetical protein
VKEGSQGELNFGFEPLPGGGGEPQKFGGGRDAGGGAAVPQAAWRAGKAPAGGARAVGRQ